MTGLQVKYNTANIKFTENKMNPSLETERKLKADLVVNKLQVKLFEDVLEFVRKDEMLQSLKTTLLKKYYAKLDIIADKLADDYKTYLKGREHIVKNSQHIAITKDNIDDFVHEYKKQIAFDMRNYKKLDFNTIDEAKELLNSTKKALQFKTKQMQDILAKREKDSFEFADFFDEIKEKAKMTTEKEISQVKNSLLADCENGNLNAVKKAFSWKLPSTRRTLANQSFLGCYLLHAACAGGHTDIARFLLEYGAKAGIRDAHDKTAYDYAGESGLYSALFAPTFVSNPTPKPEKKSSSFFRRLFCMGV